MITIIGCKCPHEHEYPCWFCETCKEICDPKDKAIREEAVRSISEAVAECISSQLNP